VTDEGAKPTEKQLRALRAAKAAEGGKAVVFNLDGAAECRDRGWLQALGGSFALTPEGRDVLARHTL
jgi:hypothetical protein